jgi:hypothetical protein
MSVQAHPNTKITKLKLPTVFSKLSKKAMLGIGIVLLVADAGGFAYYKLVYLPAQTTTTTASLHTTRVRQGDLTIYASG